MTYLLFAPLFFLTTLPAEARTLRVPPVTAEFNVGGFDTLNSPARFCQRGYHFKEVLIDNPTYKVNKRTSGAWYTMTVGLRNISNITQDVRVIIDKADFQALQWNVTEAGIRDTEFNRSFSNGATGYPVSVQIPAKKSVIINYHIGCQGSPTGNNCWAYVQPIRQNGTDISAGQTLFGTLILFHPNTAAWTQYICYNLRSILNLRVVTTQSKGSIVGTINTIDFAGSVQTNVGAATSLPLNGGKPF